MYIRTTTRKNKDGSVVRYVQLAHNVWDPKSGCSKTEVIRNLGREEDLDRKNLQRLVENVSRYLGEGIQASSSVSEQEITFEPGRSFGGVWALDQMWRRLNIDKILKRLLKNRQFETPVERVIFAMVANRALDPSSKLAVDIREHGCKKLCSAKKIPPLRSCESRVYIMDNYGWIVSEIVLCTIRWKKWPIY